MKPTLRFTLMLLLSVGAWRAQADQTNVVQELTIRLDGLTQGPTVTSGNVAITSTRGRHINDGDIIAALGTALGTAFSDASKLLVITPIDGGTSTIVVRDGSTSTDVSAFFVHEQNSGTVSSSELNLRTKRGNSTDYSVQRFALKDVLDLSPLGLHFDVSGIAVETSQTSPNNGDRTTLDASVSGAGDLAGQVVILEGRVRIHGYALEVVPDNNNNDPPNN